MMTYGDGVADVEVPSLLAFHEGHRRLATVTAVQPPGRFGTLDLAADGTTVESFVEKPRGDGAWMNGGFFVLEPEVLGYIDGDETLFEHEPLGDWRPTGNFPPTGTRASGSRWTRSATSAPLRSCGIQDRLPGRRGDVRRSVCRPPGLRDRPHGLQGGVAAVVARGLWAPR